MTNTGDVHPTRFKAVSLCRNAERRARRAKVKQTIFIFLKLATDRIFKAVISAIIIRPIAFK